jgi:hypothetical protein
MKTGSLSELKSDLNVVLHEGNKEVRGRYVATFSYVVRRSGLFNLFNKDEKHDRLTRKIELYYSARTKNIFIGIIEEGQTPESKFEGKRDDVYFNGSQIIAKHSNIALIISF